MGLLLSFTKSAHPSTGNSRTACLTAFQLPLVRFISAVTFPRSVSGILKFRFEALTAMIGTSSLTPVQQSRLSPSNSTPSFRRRWKSRSSAGRKCRTHRRSSAYVTWWSPQVLLMFLLSRSIFSVLTWRYLCPTCFTESTKRCRVSRFVGVKVTRFTAMWRSKTS
ncbi:hypothetical protein LINPERPRIM_LOCUS4007 [Linum perenne]